MWGGAFRYPQYIDIPTEVRDKKNYANERVAENKYNKYKLVEIVDGEFLDDDIVSLKIAPIIK